MQTLEGRCGPGAAGEPMGLESCPQAPTQEPPVVVAWLQACFLCASAASAVRRG